MRLAFCLKIFINNEFPTEAVYQVLSCICLVLYSQKEQLRDQKTVLNEDY